MIKIIIGLLVAAAALIYTIEEFEPETSENEKTELEKPADTSAIEYKYLPKPKILPTYTVNNAEELHNALLVAKSNDVIYIPGSELIDLTPILRKIKNKFPPRLELNKDVRLIGDGTRFGDNGAILYVSEDVKDEVLRVKSGSSISGLRFKGPQDDSDLICIQAYESPGDTILIENCEFWGWNNAAIRNRGESIKTPIRNNMIVRNNYIHDTVYKSGYGVAIAYNTFTLIEYNKFSNNKHDVSAVGKYGCDYTFRYNTNIKQWTNPKINKKSHSVDIHGWPFDPNIAPENRRRNREAGSRIEIYENHFKDSGNNEVIHIRGVPEFYARIYNNRFASTNATPIEQKYIDVQKSESRMETKNNKYRVIF